MFKKMILALRRRFGRYPDMSYILFHERMVFKLKRMFKYSDVEAKAHADEICSMFKMAIRKRSRLRTL